MITILALIIYFTHNMITILALLYLRVGVGWSGVGMGDVALKNSIFLPHIVCVHMHVCVHVCVCVSIYAHVCMCVHGCAHTCMSMCMLAYVYMCMFVCMHTCVCICMHVHVFVWCGRHRGKVLFGVWSCEEPH